MLKKPHRPCSSFFLAVVFFTALIIPARAATPVPEWTPAYTADLANPKTADNDWWISVGQAKIADGKMTITPGKHGGPEAFLYSPRFPRGARMEAAVAVTGCADSNNPVLNLHLNGDVSVGTNIRLGYLFRLSSAGCSLTRDEKPVASAPAAMFSLQAGKTYSLAAEQDDGQLTLSVDGVVILSWKDGNPLSAGVAMELTGFSSQRCTLSVQKYIVSVRKGRPADAIRPPAAQAGATITVKGPAQCIKSLFAKPERTGHGIVIYGMDGTPSVKAAWDSVVDKYYPEMGLDLKQAVTFQEKLDERCKYYLVDSPVINHWHQDLDYPSRMLSVMGTYFEKDGKKWIAPSAIETATVAYPARMTAPDRPFTLPKETLELKVTDELTLKCVKIPAGKFLCGSPFYEHPRWQDEFPHEVTLTKPLYIAEIPVTQAMFEAVTGKNPSQLKPVEFDERFRHAKSDSLPDFAVENAFWADIQLFCRKLSEKNGRKVRLLTDAEWEWAARVGTSSPCFGEKYAQQRSYVGDTQGKCEPVKKHNSNAWGLYDMVKSAWELVSDYKKDNIRVGQVDPQGPSREEAADHGAGPLRRAKGGSFYQDLHLNLHGAANETGLCEEGLLIFRVAAEEK